MKVLHYVFLGLHFENFLRLKLVELCCEVLFEGLLMSGVLCGE